jgi:hypothetical protein
MARCGWPARATGGRSWELGFGFDFDEPGGVEEAGHDDGGGGGADFR